MYILVIIASLITKNFKNPCYYIREHKGVFLISHARECGFLEYVTRASKRLAMNFKSSKFKLVTCLIDLAIINM